MFNSWPEVAKEFAKQQTQELTIGSFRRRAVSSNCVNTIWSWEDKASRF